MKAEACRRLADMSDDGLRKTIWLERADDWEGLAKKAERAAAKLKPRRNGNVLVTTDRPR